MFLGHLILIITVVDHVFFLEHHEEDSHCLPHQDTDPVQLLWSHFLISHKFTCGAQRRSTEVASHVDWTVILTKDRFAN